MLFGRGQFYPRCRRECAGVGHVDQGPPREVLLGALRLFGIHQFGEGMVWLMLENHVSAMVGNWSAWFDILSAHVLLPASLMRAFWLAEPHVRRRRMMVPFVVLGTVVTLLAMR